MSNKTLPLSVLIRSPNDMIILNASSRTMVWSSNHGFDGYFWHKPCFHKLYQTGTETRPNRNDNKSKKERKLTGIEWLIYQYSVCFVSFGYNSIEIKLECKEYI